MVYLHGQRHNERYIFSMQLTQYTDYTLRTLIFLGLNPERRCTITEISDAFNINRNHLVKVVHQLSTSGWILTVRGKNGGMTLNMPPEEINIAAVVRDTEPHMDLLECFDMATNNCCIAPVCKLRGVLYEARKAFMGVIERYSLADVLENREMLAPLLYIPSGPESVIEKPQ